MDRLVKEWLEWDRDPSTRAEIEQLVKANDTKLLESLLSKRLQFGTAGLRAKMGAGNNRMNSLTVIQAVQGIAAYLCKKYPDEARKRGVIIGFDGRHRSKQFARLAAAVLKEHGIVTYLFRDPVPTPWVSFGVGYFHCIMGLMITASHNTKEYNGCKVFADTGAQIASPTDKHISASIGQNLKPMLSSWDGNDGDRDPSEEVWKAYFRRFRQHYSPLSPQLNIKITYTAMHGVGTPYAVEALQQIGVPKEKIVLVDRQCTIDPNFSTVRSPNPEEGKEAFQLSVEKALEHQTPLILANDPDADRLAAAEWNPSEKNYYMFTGNEIAALLGWWAVTVAKTNGLDPSSCYFVYSTVSSSILNSIAKKEGMHAIDTLTGFKYMGGLAQKMESEDQANPNIPAAKKRKVLFAFEESIGYMWRNQLYDKDGVSAAAVLADMTNWLYHRGETLLGQVDRIYQTYGYHYTSNSYVHVPDPKQATQFFHDIQHYSPPQGETGKTFVIQGETYCYPETLVGATVLHVRDLSNGLDTRNLDQRATLPTSKKSPIISFFLSNGVTLTFRGSGTEPKLKWYSLLVTDRKSVLQELERFVKQVIDALVLQPRYGFKARDQKTNKTLSKI